MSTALVATCRHESGKLFIRGPQNPAMNEFYRSLPAAKFIAAQDEWRCEATPGAAWRIKNAPVHFDLDQSTWNLADRLQRDTASESMPLIRKGLPWEHQRKAYTFAFPRPAAMLGMWMGTGKTKVAIDLVQNRDSKTVLVVCPKSVLPVWRREFARHCAVPHDVLVLDGGGTVSRKTANAILHIASCRARRVMAVVVVNYEAAWRPEFLSWASKEWWGAVIADESHRMKGATTACSKAMHKIGQRSDYRLCLTGTPMPHSPLDLYGQFRFLDCGIFGTSYHWFRSRYAISGPFGADHIVAFKNQDELAQRMGLITYTADKSVLTDLPPEMHETRTVTLGAEARKLYDRFEQEAIAQVKGGVITASNALVKLLRLAQVTSGSIITDEGVVSRVDDAKAEACSELLEGMSEPAVVFCRFRADLDRVHEVAEKLGRKSGEVSGRRKDLTDQGEMPEGVDVLACQIQSGGVGVDLTRARYGIYWNHPWSLGDYDQSLNRIHRPGQVNPVTYYHLIAENTVDERVWGALEQKRDVVETVMSYLKGEQCPT